MLTLLFLIFFNFSHAVTDIIVGGIFNHFNSAGQIDNDQLEHLMAFLMAIDEINNDSTFLPGYNINYVIGSGWITVMELLSRFVSVHMIW
jgi:hypothetical protein